MRFLSHCKLRYGNLEYTTILHTTEYTNITILGGFWILDFEQNSEGWILDFEIAKIKIKIQNPPWIWILSCDPSYGFADVDRAAGCSKQ